MKKTILLTIIISILYICNVNAISLQLKRIVHINNTFIYLDDLVESWDGEQADYDRIKNIVIDELSYQRRMLNIKSEKVHQLIKQKCPDLEFSISNMLIAVRWKDFLLCPERIATETSLLITEFFDLSEESTITLTNIPRINVPSSDVQLSLEICRNSVKTNYVRVNGKIFFNNEQIQIFSLLVQVQDQRYVYQANRSIRKGEIIDVNDFSIEMVTANISIGNSYLPIDDIILQQNDAVATTFIGKGSYLKSSDIVTTPFIQRNDSVTVIIKSATVNLSYEAVSKADGWLGDRIMLQNPESKQTFFAVVVDKNKVLIDLED